MENFCSQASLFLVFEIFNMIFPLLGQQGINEVLSIIDGQHQKWSNGIELLEEAQQNKIILPIGCERIDMLLQGGLFGGHLIELVGPSSSGKTQICLQAAANAAKNYLGSVKFFDTGNSFLPKRIAQIVCQISDPADIEVRYVTVTVSCGWLFN